MVHHMVPLLLSVSKQFISFFHLLLFSPTNSCLVQHVDVEECGRLGIHILRPTFFTDCEDSVLCSRAGMELKPFLR
ncbi:hypothetical protein F0562_006174 [Nyssa sinensis]|uniref:Secreted protein n=1 Tax=Nyssa sinensis TaxID=561372 RepID=A0A5J5AK98_9ASTE|nr:hypothetical protein F0562_006174 [Nyssa sinensis]